jgi:hypothetical protein
VYIILAIFGVAGLVAVNAVASHFRKDARALRAFRKMPQRFVTEFSERESAKLVGKVSYVGEPLRSPLTGRECAAYSIVIQSCFEESPEGIRRWSTVIRESSGQEFSIDDGTGHAIVDPTHAEFGLVTTSVTESGGSNAPTESEARFLAKHQRSGGGFHKIRYMEGILRAGDTVAVLARGTTEPDPEGASRQAGYREAPPMRVRMSGSPKSPLVLSTNVCDWQPRALPEKSAR